MSIFKDDLDCVKYYLNQDLKHIAIEEVKPENAGIKQYFTGKKLQIQSTLDVIKSIEENK